MLSVLHRVGIRHLYAKPARTLLTIVAVTLGMGLSVSISIINRSVLASFRETITALSGNAVLTVSAGETGFPEERIEEIAKVPGVKSAIPRVEAWGYSVGDAATSRSIYILGVDLLKEQAVRSYKSDNRDLMDDPLVFLNDPESVILGRDFARARGLGIGSKLALATARGQISLTVRGLLDPEGLAKAYDGAIAIMDIDGAREMLGKENKTDAVDIIARPGVETDALQTSLRAALGPPFVVAPPEGYAHDLERLVRPFQTMLAFFGQVALIVGLFLVANSVSMTVAERKKEIGVLRALGAARWQIFVLFAVECVVVGGVGSVLGAYAGCGLASLMVDSVVESMTNQFRMTVSVHTLAFDRRVVLEALAMGVATALIAGFAPISRATRVSPTAAVREGPGEIGSAELGDRGLFALGCACVVFVLVTLLPALDGVVSVQSIGQIMAIVGVTLVSPLLVQRILGFVAPLLRGGSDVVPRIAAENIARYERRTRANVIVLTLGLVLVMIISGISQSFKQTLRTWFDVSLHHDLLVSSTGRILQGMAQPIHEDLAADLATVPGVRRSRHALEGGRIVHIDFQGHPIALRAIDEPDPAFHYWGFDLHDRTPDEAGHDLYHLVEPTVLVSTNFGLHFGKKTGDSITLDTPSGPTSFRIVGVMTEFTSPEGCIVMARDRYKQLWHDPLITAFGVMVEAGVNPAVVRDAIEARLGREKNLMVALNGELKSEFVKTIDKSFAFTVALEAAALLVALIAIFNTLSIGILERTREIGMLRGIGMSRNQLARMVFLEAAVLGAITAALAVVTGSVVGYWLVTRSLPTSLGWVLHYALPAKSVFGIFALGVLVAITAGALPAWRAARMQITDALEP